MPERYQPLLHSAQLKKRISYFEWRDSGSYDCLDDDVDGSQIKASVKEEKTKQVKWTSSPEQTEGAFRVEVEPSRYSLCFTNEVDEEEDGGAEKEAANVGFSLRYIPPPRALEDGVEGPEAQRALKLVETASGIDQDWQNLLDHYDFLRNREGAHTEMIQQIFSRLVRWTIIEAVLVISMAVAQVLYLRKFFEQRRYL